MKTIIVYGLRRSGNHFLISLILQQFVNYVHINDTYLSYEEYNKYKYINKQKERSDNIWCGFKDVDCVLISLENKTIDNHEVNKFMKLSNCYFLMLLRCPYSHLSSVWKVYEKNSSILLNMTMLWKIYANYFINNNLNFIYVLYDELSTNDNYIKNILHKLNIEIININKNKQIPWQESSYLEIKNKQNVYKTLENCVYKDDKDFLQILNDKEIFILWEIILKIITHQ